MVLTCAAGYTGPGLFGLGAAALLAAGHAVGLLWALLALLALLLVQIRNWYGLWSVLVTGGVVFAATWWLPPEGQAAFAALAHLVPAAGRAADRAGAAGAPAAGAARRTPTPTSSPGSPALPALVWVGVFLLVDVGALRPRRALAARLTVGVPLRLQRRPAAPARGSQPGGWPHRLHLRRRRDARAPGPRGPTVTCRPWWRMSSGSPSTSR